MLTRSLPVVALGILMVTQSAPKVPNPLEDLRRAMTAAVRSLDIPHDVQVMLVDRLDLVVPVKGDSKRFRALNRQLADALPPRLRDLWLERALDVATRPDSREYRQRLATVYNPEADAGTSWSTGAVCGVVYNLAGDVRLRGSALGYMNHSRLKREIRTSREILDRMAATGRLPSGRLGKVVWDPCWPAVKDPAP